MSTVVDISALRVNPQSAELDYSCFQFVLFAEEITVAFFYTRLQKVNHNYIMVSNVISSPPLHLSQVSPK